MRGGRPARNARESGGLGVVGERSRGERGTANTRGARGSGGLGIVGERSRGECEEAGRRAAHESPASWGSWASTQG
eukprot:9488104-Pyramimonas_sp.AAC.2